MSELLEILDHINPAALDYQEWVNVGMALKDEGYACKDWDNWSKGDPARYHAGDCEKKWQSFNGSAAPVTAGTIIQYAKDQGWQPNSYESRTFDWCDEINAEEDGIVSRSSEGVKLSEPADWHPAKEIIQYLEALFEASETVGYVTETWEKTEDSKTKYLPTKGSYTRTAGELIAELNKHGDDIGAVLGDYNPAAGAWIRFNPLDGKGVKNENVTDYRYALVESDSMALEEQNAIIRELELPVAILVYSGGKSIHAIVKIDASDYSEYRKRVDYLYNICHKNGLEIDKQNRKDSTGQYMLMQNTGNVSGAFPYMLLGKPVYISENMPVAAAGARSVLYGDYSGLGVNMRQQIEMQVLNEKYATQHAVGIVGWFEVDCNVINHQKLAALVHEGEG